MTCLHDGIARVHSVDTATGVAQVTCAQCGAHGTRSADLVYTWDPTPARAPRTSTTHTITLSSGVTIALKDIRAVGMVIPFKAPRLPRPGDQSEYYFTLRLADMDQAVQSRIQSDQAVVEAERQRLVTAWEVFLGVQPGCRTYEDA